MFVDCTDKSFIDIHDRCWHSLAVSSLQRLLLSRKFGRCVTRFTRGIYLGGKPMKFFFALWGWGLLLCFLCFTSLVNVTGSYVPVKSKLQHPSPHPRATARATPRAFEFLENLCSNSSLPGLKSCSNAPTRTRLRGRSGGLFH